MRSNGGTAGAVEDADSDFRFHVGKAAIFGAGVMVLVSGYTTAKGLLDIVGWSQLYIVIMASIVVQGMLAIAAWFLGQELARYVLRSRLRAGIEPPSAALTAVTASVFLVTFCASFFFAFSFWYNELRSLSQRTEEARQIPNTFQTIVMTELLRSVKAARESELEEPSQDGASGGANATQVWLGNLIRVSKVARDARGDIQERLNAAIRKRQEAAKAERENQQRVSTQVRDARNKLDAARRGKEEALREIAAIEARLEPFERELEPLRQEREQYEQERLKECAGIQGRRSRCGPKARAAERARDAVQARINEIEAPLRADRERLVRLKSQVTNADRTIEEQTRLLEGLGSSGDPTRTPGEQGGDLSLPGAEGIARLLKALDDRRQDFLKTGTPEAYGAAVQACAAVLELLTEAKVAPETLSQLSCESSAALQRAESRPQREAARARFARECSADEMSEAARQASALIPVGQQRVDAKALADSFVAINQKIQSCISMAIATGADVSQAEQVRSEFARAHAPDRDRFDEALAGLRSGGAHRNAAAGIAAIFDLMILALSFFADLFNIRGHSAHHAAAPTIRRAHVDVSPDPTDPVPLAGAKALRRFARYDVGLRSFVIDLNTPEIDGLNPDVRENVRIRLDSFLQARLADRLKDGRHILSETAQGELEAYIDEQRLPQSALQSTLAEPGPFEGSGTNVPRAMPAPAANVQGASRVEPTPLAAGQNRRPRQAGDLASVPWRKPVTRPGQSPPPASQRSAEADAFSSARATPDPAPTRSDGAGLGIAGLMNRERREP